MGLQTLPSMGISAESYISGHSFQIVRRLLWHHEQDLDGSMKVPSRNGDWSCAWASVQKPRSMTILTC